MRNIIWLLVLSSSGLSVVRSSPAMFWSARPVVYAAASGAPLTCPQNEKKDKPSDDKPDEKKKEPRYIEKKPKDDNRKDDKKKDERPQSR